MINSSHANNNKKYYKNPTTGRAVETAGQKARWALEARMERERVEIAEDVNKGFAWDNAEETIF